MPHHTPNLIGKAILWLIAAAFLLPIGGLLITSAQWFYEIQAFKARAPLSEIARRAASGTIQPGDRFPANPNHQSYCLLSEYGVLSYFPKEEQSNYLIYDYFLIVTEHMNGTHDITHVHASWIDLSEFNRMICAGPNEQLVVTSTEQGGQTRLTFKTAPAAD